MQNSHEQHKVLIIPDEIIKQRIYLIRSQKVMLDSDLAGLYGTQTRRVKEQVKRNIDRFRGYVFQLTKEEAREQFEIPALCFY